MDNLEFKTLTAAEFDEYLKNHKETDYQIIDVRQESEYERGHIPGAKLMPLAEVELKLFSLPADRDLVFYCQNGGRSQWAASLAGEGGVSTKNVYTLMGGLLAWEGTTLPGYPKVEIFDRNQELEKLLAAAMNLEKGAWRFYRYAREKFNDYPISQLLEQISIAEKGHAVLIHRFCRKFATDPPSFEQFFQCLAGDILEGGIGFDDACRLLQTAPKPICKGIIDLALNIEFAAYDLYRVMAERTDNSEAREAFTAIAQAEKGHMRVLVRAMGQCFESTSN
jgi:rubrerythrin/rhodanese-related sulfurtransferase